MYPLSPGTIEIPQNEPLFFVVFELNENVCTCKE